MIRRILLSIVAFLLAAPSFAVEIGVSLQRHPSGGVDAASAEVVAVSAGDVTKKIRSSLPGKLDLPAGEWFLEVHAGDDWSETRLITVRDNQPQTVELSSYRAARLEARAALPGGKPPVEMKVSFQRARLGDEDTPVEGSVACDIARGVATCRLPAGELDLSFRVIGYASRFRWGVKLSPGATFDSGSIGFVPGSTLSGRVEVPKGHEAQIDRVAIVARPVSPPGSNEEQIRRADAAKVTAKPNARGLFAIDLPAGQFTVQASLTNLISEDVVADVVAGHEAPLREPLRLEPQKSVTVRVNPPLDPWSKPWRLKLETMTNDGLVVSERVARTDRDGNGRFEQLRPGLYLLHVSRAANQDWVRKFVELGSGDATIDLDVETIYVTGSIRMGSRPIEAQATLASEQNGAVAVVQSKADGTFAAQLPSPGNDTATWDRVVVESDSPAINKTLAHVRMERHDDRPAEMTLEIPSRLINGTVVDELGEKVRDAIIDIVSSDGTMQQVLSPDGLFTAAGFGPGRYRLRAAAHGRATPDAQELVVGDDVAAISDVTLIVTPEAHLRGSIRALENPVLGAVLSPIVLGGHTPIVQYRTDMAGAFDIHLPSSSQQLSLMINAPGFAVRLLKASASAREQAFAVDQNGGALVVDVPVHSGLVSYLFHDGAGFPAPGVAWIAGVGLMGNPDERVKFQVPLMEAGAYSLCWIPQDVAPAVVANGCIEGVLAPHGTLTLKQ